MGQKSNWLAQQMANFYLGNGTPPTPPSHWWYILSTAAYDPAATGSACNEVGSGLGYARAEVNNDSTEWVAATGGNPWVKENTSDASFGTATGSWGTINSVYLCDASTAGDIWFGVDVVPITVTTGSGAHVPAGAFIVNEY